MRQPSALAAVVSVISVAFCASCALAGPPGSSPDYDFDWVTIGDVANPAYGGDSNPSQNYPFGRGSVGYSYRIARTEVTTAQWVEFMNTFTTQAGIDAFSSDWSAPVQWGAFRYRNPAGPGIVYRLENYAEAAQQPVAGISWRQAARFCNWLHSGKSSSPSSLVSGAYDTTTWGGGFGTGMPATDAERRLPGARFWIPSIDEWVKSAHYDPDRFGPGQGGYWQFPNRSNVPPISGLPGVGESSIDTNVWRIPVGSFPLTRSAYGLLDLSGGPREWLEDVYEHGRFYSRFTDGSSTNPTDPGTYLLDEIRDFGAGYANLGAGLVGLRVVTIPEPSFLGFAAAGFGVAGRRRRSLP